MKKAKRHHRRPIPSAEASFGPPFGKKRLAPNEFETLSGLVAGSDGGAVFCGNTGKKAQDGSGDVYLAKTDAKGNLSWKKFFGGKDWEEALDLIPTRDGGFALAGLTN